MARDTSLPVRRAIVAHLKADSAVSGLVPTARIFGPETPPLPEWPFIRYGVPTQAPFKPSGTDGSVIDVDLHGFAKGPGEDAASVIGAAMAASLDDAILDLTADAGFPATAYVSHIGTQMVQDAAEQGAWHVIVRVRVTVSS